MIKALDKSIMGMNAMGTRLAVTANNIANCNTDEFKKDRVTLTEARNGGVLVQDISKVNTPGTTVEVYEETRELSNVDLGEEFVNLMTTQAGYTANAKVIKTQEELTGTILDIKR
ncbi:MAG: flagellar basal body rod C-terminal domain-containing protein [Desulfuromonadaceae bacterium]|jgi:flagellar hook protein FlgE